MTSIEPVISIERKKYAIFNSENYSLNNGPLVDFTDNIVLGLTYSSEAFTLSEAKQMVADMTQVINELEAHITDRNRNLPEVSDKLIRKDLEIKERLNRISEFHTIMLDSERVVCCDCEHYKPISEFKGKCQLSNQIKTMDDSCDSYTESRYW